MKFRKSPHWTEKSLRHAQKPANPRSANPCGPESTSVTPGKDPPMATPPQGRKMAPERPFPILIETGKSHPKTGLLPAVFGGFPTVLPVVSRRFPGGFPAVFQRFCRRFSGGFPAVFSASSTPVFRQFPGGFLGKFDGGWTAIFRQHAFPGSTPRSDSGPSPSSERNVKKRRQFRTHFHAYKPSIAAFSKVCL